MVELEVLGVHIEQQPVVLLHHDDRILPILVGSAEADAIHMGLMKRSLGRPMTHDLICNLLAGLHGELQSVTIYKLEQDTFYAHLNIEQKTSNGTVEQVLRIDSRPSDGIAIAVRLNCPIYAATEVMDAAGQDMVVEPQSDDSEDLDSPEFDS